MGAVLLTETFARATPYLPLRMVTHGLTAPCTKLSINHTLFLCEDGGWSVFAVESWMATSKEFRWPDSTVTLGDIRSDMLKRRRWAGFLRGHTCFCNSRRVYCTRSYGRFG